VVTGRPPRLASCTDPERVPCRRRTNAQPCLLWWPGRRLDGGPHAEEGEDRDRHRIVAAGHVVTVGSIARRIGSPFEVRGSPLFVWSTRRRGRAELAADEGRGDAGRRGRESSGRLVEVEQERGSTAPSPLSVPSGDELARDGRLSAEPETR